jgi:hypothetical protein
MDGLQKIDNPLWLPPEELPPEEEYGERIESGLVVLT